ncbi:autotransporter outer membrane beta-barrel domain-containing protein [Morganella morganii]|uniref:autotransporter outer membrane beta-barrel domain-containing protein n=1 Tax=Morganella morganii TaxID=582 RepID=UPI001BDAA9A3|nr:autotransporter outer membrane beta-barrel domain-containing protein [Morganella morganii]MBT0420522.1 autotransporter outer membrane beta-barrel domain-containing protein [Morganella morganii subsp. morganii]MBT0514768.1 autotransporter outer membrane beta-barrel domain-containing protein [Morganella morganii subsp. morganii]QWM03361.1 autotransporter outer membrane beta-barrel domain-containing protein [Morganella morganii subsp. morganii]
MYYSHRTENDGSLTRIGVNYDYEYFYSAVEVDTLAITDSSVRINGKADNLTVGGKSVVTITGSDAYSKYRGADYENPSNPQSTLPLYRNGYDNNRRDEITVSTGNGTYNDESKQYLDGEHIGDVKKPDNSNATLTIKGTDVTDARLGADKGEYLVATGDTFNGKAEQHIGENSLSQGATFNGQSSQHLKGKDGKKAVSLDATFTGTAGVKHTGQTVGSNGLAIDSTFDYANQDISSGGVAKNNTLRNGDQNVSGEADNTKITNGNQTVSGKATTNSIDNTNGTHGLQLVSGTATDNTLKNADQIIEKTGVAVKNVIDNAGAEHGIQVVRGKAEDNTLSNTDQRVEKDGISSVKNDITDGNQFVDGFAENNTITNKATNRGKQVINGTANNNKLTETDQLVGQNGTAGIKNDITNGSQYVDGLAENNTITNKADKRGEQVISGTANNNKLTNTNQIVKKGGLATDNTLTGNSHLTVENGGEAKNNTLNGDIDMIVEANGKATGKTTFNGKNHLDLYAATTNGAYVEDLALSQTKGKSSVTVYEGTQEHDAVTIGTLNGKAAVNFDHRTNPAGHTQMNINNLGNNDPAQYDNTTLDFTMNSNILNGNSDFINTDNAYGQHYVTIIERDTGKEAVLNRPQSADFAYVKNVAGDSNAVFGMKDADGKILNLMDAGTYIHNIQTRTGADNDTTWSFTATDRLTPSARAVLALSSAPQLMYNNEVDHLRARLHMLRTSDSIENGLWMQGIGSNTKVDKDQIQYKLKHAGLELGADYQLALNSDSKLVLGGFTGFDKGDVKNDWAGTSDIDSYTFGAYATYLNSNGWYGDALLKYNHFDNKLKTTSTNGYDVSSDNYSTSVWGMALETGYTFTFSNQIFITPYGQLAYNRMGSKDITLNNGMDAAIKSQTSFTSELGVNAGKDFSFDSGLVFSPYVKAAWNHQYEDGNEVEFNRYNTINLDLSGSTGKFGAGFNARYNNVNMFMELQHIAGDAVYSPINGQVGIRYNF